jgi:hypothetical protein
MKLVIFGGLEARPAADAVRWLSKTTFDPSITSNVNAAAIEGSINAAISKIARLSNPTFAARDPKCCLNHHQEIFPLLTLLFMLRSENSSHGALNMNPHQTETPSALDPNLLAVIIRSTLDTIPHHPDASAEERDADRRAAYTLLTTFRPRDPMEAMLAARIVASQFHLIDDLRCAALPDLPTPLKLRHRRSAATLTLMHQAAQRELIRRQAFPALQPATLPAAIPAPRPLPAPAAAKPCSASGGVVPPTSAQIDQLVAEVEANLDAQPAAPRPAAAARPPAAARPTAHDDDATPTDAEFDQLVAGAHALLQEVAEPPKDLADRLQAEVAARTAATTQLAA